MQKAITPVWHWIEWNRDDTWSSLVPQLEECGLEASSINRVVYVIRIAESFTIRYPNGASPVIYIGQGNFKNRIQMHKSWANEMSTLIKDVSMEIVVATPRRQNARDAYKYLEAALLNSFQKKYGAIPLNNSKLETEHSSYIFEGFDKVFQRGKGTKKYKWAIEPLPCCSFYSRFHKGMA